MAIKFMLVAGTPVAERQQTNDESPLAFLHPPNEIE